MQSESIAALAKAIAEAQRELKPVKKDSDNPFFKSKYADLASVWEALKPFHDHGISITQSPAVCEFEGCIALETQLTHESGEWMRSTLVLPVVKHDPQGVGSAITYARRYALGCMTGVVTEDDDDGNAATGNSSPARQYTQHKQTVASKFNELRNQGLTEADRNHQETDAAPPSNISLDLSVQINDAMSGTLINAILQEAAKCQVEGKLTRQEFLAIQKHADERRKQLKGK